MKRFIFVIFCFFVISPALAGGLSEKTQSMSLGFSYVDTDDLGKETDLSVGWAYGFKEGLVQVGASVSYFSQDFDGSDKFDSSTIGPLVAINFMPAAKATPYISFEVVTVGGDLGDAYDLGYGAGAGVKAFIGDSASPDVGVGFSRLQSDISFLDDLDSTVFLVGVSFYFGNR